VRMSATGMGCCDSRTMSEAGGEHPRRMAAVIRNYGYESVLTPVWIMGLKQTEKKTWNPKSCFWQNNAIDIDGRTEVILCVQSGDLEALKQLLEGVEESQESLELKLFARRDEVGRNVLMIASMLGRSDTVRELVGHGAPVNEQTVRGYSALHLAACWGHEDTVRTLVELGADLQAQTFRGETPVDLSSIYSRTDCTERLILAGGYTTSQCPSSFCHVIIPHQLQNARLHYMFLCKCLQNICAHVSSAKSDWIQNAKNPTVSDFTAQRQDFEEALQPVLNKLSALCKYPAAAHVFILNI
uniref:Ankyrin repeat domain 45 n=1 Tax=Amphiprion percula TaxID=161767 RepID=A0A3P8SEV8_AMPPE